MLKRLIAIPIMILLLLAQMSVVSRMPLLHGTPDLLLMAVAAWSLQDSVQDAWIWALTAGVMVSFISAMPTPTPLVVYLGVTAMARLLRRRVWQAPILAMLVTTFAGTLLMQGLYFVVLKFSGSPIGLGESLNQVILPSLMLNMLLALPVHTLFADLATWVYPVELEL